jgi:hypothetical protein
VSQNGDWRYADIMDAEKAGYARPDELVVVWTSGNRDVALKMVFMYILNAAEKKWWEKVTLVVWGPSAHLLATDLILRSKVMEMKNSGIHMLACQTCAEMYDVVLTLSSLGIEVKYMGETLTGYLKDPRCRVITF